MKKIKNPWLEKEGYNCFGCAPENPIGLHLDFFEDGDDIVSFWKPGTHYQGWVNTLHGGIIATLIDEVCGWVITRKLQTAGMTTRLDVRYKHPLMSDDSLITIRARITARKRNIISIHAEVSDSRNQICAEGDVVYYAMGEERAKEMGFTHCDVEDEQLLSM